MRKLFILLSVMLLSITSCNYTPKEVKIDTDYCLIIEDYDKTICLDYPSDTLYDFIFIDKNILESGDKFNGLSVYIMMVVNVDGDIITLSNVDHSIKVKFDKIPKIQDMYYVICKEVQLSESVLVNFSFNFEESISDSIEIVEEP